nr:uncharacterized protein LOC109397338 [Aedes albopictus]
MQYFRTAWLFLILTVFLTLTMDQGQCQAPVPPNAIKRRPPQPPPLPQKMRRLRFTTTEEPTTTTLPPYDHNNRGTHNDHTGTYHNRPRPKETTYPPSRNRPSPPNRPSRPSRGNRPSRPPPPPPPPRPST